MVACDAGGVVAMRPRRHAAQEEETLIDLAPMLDFVLNLLIFFIVTSSFIKEPGVSVLRPTAQTATHQERGNILIAVRPDGQVWIDKKRVDVRDVRVLVERMHTERPDDTVVIVADRAAKTGVVSDVMDQVRAGGVGMVSIAARQPGA